MILLAPAARTALFALIVVCTGAAAFRWLVLARTGGSDGGAMRAAARVGRGAAALLLPALGALFLAQFLDFREPSEPALAEATLLASLPWGRIWLLQCATALGLLVAYALAARETAGSWGAAALLATLLSFTPAMSGHAAAVEEWTTLAMLADGSHVLAAGTWVGSLFLLAWTSLGSGCPREVLLSRVRAFSPVALASAVVIAATGTFGAWLHLGRLADLVTSSYGQLLSAKLVTFAAVLAVGAYNWRRATPRLAADDGGALTRSIVIELALVFLVLVVTAWFVATSPEMH